MASNCRIMLLNDDYTPMEFVVAVLQEMFSLTQEQATAVMLNTHRQGRFTVATMEKSAAEETVRIIHERARQAGHPFKCILEPEVAGSA
ncbi:MAG TPA: ATP-dependent Clp protease adaptor ClpS [Acetobacteraceae bacterium]|nr:ATP-dependent Clp protease adaptor ClpS [Acetobacteraceae bacterium]